MAEYFQITRVLPAPRELVFDVISLPEHFAVWFGTQAVNVPGESLVMDIREGGEFRAVMELPDGNKINWSGQYTSVQRPAHLAMTLTDQPNDDTGLLVLFDLVEVAGGTELSIRQDRANFSQGQVDATIAGYNAFVDDMAEVVESLRA